MHVLTELQGSTSATCDDQGKVVVLVGGAISHAGAEGEDGVIEQGGAVGLLVLSMRSSSRAKAETWKRSSLSSCSM